MPPIIKEMMLYQAAERALKNTTLGDIMDNSSLNDTNIKTYPENNANKVVHTEPTQLTSNPPSTIPPEDDINKYIDPKDFHVDNSDSKTVTQTDGMGNVWSNFLTPSTSSLTDPISTIPGGEDVTNEYKMIPLPPPTPEQVIRHAHTFLTPYLNIHL